MNFLGIDVGKGYVKAYCDKGQMIYPSAISRGVMGNIETAEPISTSASLSYAGGDFILGEKAELGDMKWSLGDKKSNYESLLHILFTCSSLLNCNCNDAVVVGVGLPVGNYESEKNTLKEIAKGEHRFRKGGKEYIVSIDPYIIPEGIGAYCAEVMNEKGEFVQDKMPGNTLVVDLGYKTLDTCLVDGTVVSMKGWSSAFLGISRVVNIVASKVQRRMGVMMPEEVNRIKKAIADGKFTILIRGTPVDISSFVQSAIKDVFLQIKDHVENTMRDVAAEGLLFVGGGSILFRDDIIKHFPFARIQGDIYSNARGFYYLIRRKFSKNNS